MKKFIEINVIIAIINIIYLAAFVIIGNDDNIENLKVLGGIIFLTMCISFAALPFLKSK